MCIILIMSTKQIITKQIINLMRCIKELPSDIQYIIYKYDDTYRNYYNNALKSMLKKSTRWRTNFKLLPYESNGYIYRNYNAGYTETYDIIKKRCDTLNDHEIILRKRYNAKYWTYSYYYPIYEFKPILDIKYEHENTHAIPLIHNTTHPRPAE
jgi:hypothetical protein